MDKKAYLIVMRVVDAVLFMLAVLFMIIDAFQMRYIFRVLYASFFCAAALLLIVSSILDLLRMERFVKKIEEIEDESIEQALDEQDNEI